ncbi:MAG TPA: alginate lyase family protein, partial [Bryobacteraceae bacterium]|nr:alginate lyase family protein [Bryobacteraceae bacterium]
MRSPREIAFRVRQELANLRLAAIPPSPAVQVSSPLPLLPDSEAVVQALRGGVFAERVLELADGIVRREIPLLGYVLHAEPPVAWNRDYIHGRDAPGGYFRRVPYLDFHRAGDHKIIWELNRHQHLVVLAQAYRFSGRRAYLDMLTAEIDHWITANPFARGINWVSALEVALRALSWIWVFHLTAGEWTDSFRARFSTALYQHGRYLEENLSLYFSPNTHLLGEGLALHALGVLFTRFPRAAAWARTGANIVREQMRSQVQEDGSHFEQSSYYHVYALDMFLFHAVLTSPDEWFRAGLARMADFLDALLGDGAMIPLLGDDDGGRLFHPYGERCRFGLATLATAGVLLGRPEWIRSRGDLEEQACWWLGGRVFSHAPAVRRVRESQLFPSSGLVFLRSRTAELVIDAGPFGPGSAGHSHSDALSVIARDGDTELLVDSGTFTYVSDPALRDWFRGSAAHNTIRVDGRNQAQAAGPFRWNDPPRVVIAQWHSSADRDFLDAFCEYSGFRHRRRVLWLKSEREPFAVLVDDICAVDADSDREHLVEQFWHAGAAVEPLGHGCYRIGRMRL